MCNAEIEVTFDESEFRDVIADVAVSYQRTEILAMLSTPPEEFAKIDALAMSLLGEATSYGIVVPTRTSSAGTDVNAPITSYIKRELRDLLCTNSTRYKNERKEGLSTVKNLVMIVTTAVSSHYSLPGGIVAGAVSLLLMAALKIGRNAYCEASK
jgi:hypothetical protein